MAKIMLFSPPYRAGYMRNARCDFVSLSATQWYPILLGWLGAYLEGHGHTVALIDGPAAGATAEDCRERIRRFAPDLLVLYAGRLSRDSDLEQVAVLGRDLPGLQTVVVGPFANLEPDDFLAHAPVGMPLATGPFERQVAALAAGRPLPSVAGWRWREADGTIRDSGPAELLDVAEMAAMPFVSRFLARNLDLNWYRTPSEPFPFIDLMTGRGCAWGRCTFCLWVHTHLRGAGYRVRPVEHVIAELDFIRRELPTVRSVMIQDDTFTAERAVEFATAKLRAGNPLPWSCYARADLPLAAMQVMKRAGCLNLHVGFESGSDAILRTIGKGLTSARMRAFARDAKRAGLRLHADFMIGFPGETEADVQDTLRQALRVDPDTVQFQILIPFPGTPLARMMRERGLLDAAGEPDQPQLSRDRVRELVKRCYRRFYLSARYALKCLRSPRVHLWGKGRTIAAGMASMFWRRL